MSHLVTRQPRDPLAWSLARPGEELYIGAMVRHPPEHLDPDLTPCFATVPMQIRFEETRQARIDAARHTMIGMAFAACLMAIAVSAFAGAALRLPAIEQQLAYDART